VVNGKPLGYLLNISDTVLDGANYGQVILADCHNVTVMGGQFQNVTAGVLLGFSSGCIIRNGSVRNNNDGAVVYASSSHFINMTIDGNTESGVLFIDSSGSLEFSHFFNNGVVLTDSILNNTNSSTVNGKTLGYLNSVANSTIDGDEFGQLILNNCYNLTVVNASLEAVSRGVQVFSSDSCKFKNSSFSFNSGAGAWILNSDDFELENCSVTNNEEMGVYLGYSERGNISECWIGHNGADGLYVDSYCHDFLFYNNTLFSNYIHGIQVMDNCDNVFIHNNTIRDNSAGMYIRESGFSEIVNNTVADNFGPGLNANYGIGLSICYNSTIEGNIVYGQYESGINLDWCVNATIARNRVLSNYHRGVQIYDTNGCKIAENEIIDSSYGLVFWKSSYNRIINNTIIANRDLGIEIDWSSDNNQIYSNSIGWNLLRNAQDDGQNNTWDDGMSTGNYWDDYLGSGVYPIFGSAGSVDNYPFVLIDTEPPKVDSPDDITYEYDSSNNQITWHPSDISPVAYRILVNGSEDYFAAWDGGEITYSIDGLELGVHNITLVLCDTGLNNVSDSVLVTVLDTQSPILNPSWDRTIEVGSIGIFLSWEATDTHPASYEVLRNELPYRSGLWNSSSDVVSVDLAGLSIGFWNYTIIFFDSSDNWASDEVMVTVTPDETPPSITQPLDLVYEVGTAGNQLSWFLTDTNPESYVIYQNQTLVESGNWTSPSREV
ncbi:MAG: right-handed parallel beta-helix repeat-containing protein, partial [Candidatus Thorarchaeota archaeon]